MTAARGRALLDAYKRHTDESDDARALEDLLADLAHAVGSVALRQAYTTARNIYFQETEEVYGTHR